MFKPTDPQSKLFNASYHLHDSARKRLEDTWAPVFRREMMPILLRAEEEFADLYPSDTGRSCWSVARKLGICILQELLDLSDRATVNALCFDVRWHYALMLQPEEAYLSRVSIWDFRSRLVAVDPDMKRLGALLECIGKEAVKQLGLSTSNQRCDSTHITSNIEVKGRGHLFRKTLVYFDDWLQKQWPDERERLSSELLEWLDNDSDGWFGRLNKEQYNAKLKEMACWMVEIVETFASNKSIANSERFGLIAQLIDEHCIVTPDAGPKKKEWTTAKTSNNQRLKSRM